MPLFPMFVDIESKNILVVGGGTVAQRKIERLMPFKPYISVVGKKVNQHIKKLTERYKNISFEVDGAGAYGKLRGESGVMRLVRKSPFNAKSKRQTSFALVDVTPEVGFDEFDFDESKLEFSFSKSSGAGGQNVNKRDTAVRVVDSQTGLFAFVSSQRSQEQNRQKAVEVLRSKLYKKYLEDKKKKEEGLSVTKGVKVEWGSQIRSFVFDPYKMIKDHRSGVEVRNIDKVLGGDLSEFYKKEEE